MYLWRPRRSGCAPQRNALALWEFLRTPLSTSSPFVRLDAEAVVPLLWTSPPRTSKFCNVIILKSITNFSNVCNTWIQQSKQRSFLLIPARRSSTYVPQRRREAPPNFAYYSLICCASCVKMLTPGHIRSCLQVTLSDVTLKRNLASLTSCHIHSSEYNFLKLLELDDVNSYYDLYILEFWHLWPEAMSISWPAHVKSMRKIFNYLFSAS